MGPMPGASIGVQLRIGDLSKSRMHLLPLLRQRRPVDRRPHERMPKTNPRAELDQARLGRRRRRFGANPELRGSSPHQCLIADRLGRGDQQQAPGLDGEIVEPPAEALFDTTGQSHRAGSPNPPASCWGVNPRGNSSNASGLP